MAITQSTRKVQITTPLGKDALIVSQFSGVEQISSLFQFDISMLSEKGELSPDEILGKDVTVKYDLPGGQKRFFHGFVTEFSQGSTGQRFHQSGRCTGSRWTLLHPLIETTSIHEL